MMITGRYNPHKYILVLGLIGLGLLLNGCAARSGLRLPAWLEDSYFKSDLTLARTRGGLTLVAPASGLSQEEIASLPALASKLGLYWPAGSVAPGLIPYNANTDEERGRYLAEALNDPQTRVIWALRGGYGSSRLLAKLRWPPRSKPKIFVGYSDLTFVHLFLAQAGWPSIHGAMITELSDRGKDRDNFLMLAGLLSGRIRELNYGGLKPFNQAARDMDRPIGGTVIGGNLACLAASLGTPWALEADGRILFLEDVNEPGYKIDRLLTQLRNAGRLKGVRAVILGAFVGGDQQADFALERFARDFDRPVFKTELFGHGPQNYPLIFNVPAHISPETGQAGFRLKISADLP